MVLHFPSQSLTAASGGKQSADLVSLRLRRYDVVLKMRELENRGVIVKSQIKSYVGVGLIVLLAASWLMAGCGGNSLDATANPTPISQVSPELKKNSSSAGTPVPKSQ